MLKINLKKKVKKKDKPKKFTGQGLKIVDEDSFANYNNQTVEESDPDEADELPQIANVVDERPVEVQLLETFNKGKWKRLDEDEDDSNKAKSIGDLSPPRRKTTDDTPPPRQRRRRDSDGDSPPRQRKRWDSSDTSPPRRRRNSNDSSPPRRRRRNDSDATSPPRQRRRRSTSADRSPPRQRSRHSHDTLPPFKKQRRPDSQSSRSRRDSGDISPQRRRRNSRDSSPPPRNQTRRSSPGRTSPSRQRRRHDSDDTSPPRPTRRRSPDGDMSPPRQRQRRVSNDSSPPRQRRARDSDGDMSPIRRRNVQPSRNSNYGRRDKDRNVARPEVLDASDDDDSKSKTTLDGKKAGLQKATALRNEMVEFRKRENEMFELLPDEVSGRHAKAVVRDRRTEEDLAKEREKEKKEAERKQQYDKWGKGLKQVEEQEERVRSALHEISKPLARYKNDDDLDDHLKSIDREGDPMLEYLSTKRRKATGEPEKPKYKGPPPPPNRFKIPPGFRWDGVDRSNGYEKEWFSRINAKKAIQEEAYKWSVEDL